MQETFTGQSVRVWPLNLEWVAINLYAKCVKDCDIRKIKFVSRSVAWQNTRKHYGSLFSQISYAMLEAGYRYGESEIRIFDPTHLNVTMRYLLIAEKVIDMGLLLFYKGEHFAYDLEDVLMPTFIEVSADWTFEDYGDAISHVMCEGCDCLSAFEMCDQSQFDDPTEWLCFHYDELFKIVFLKYLLVCMKRLRSNVVSLRSVQSRIDDVFLSDVYVDQLEELALYLAHVHTLIHAV